MLCSYFSNPSLWMWRLGTKIEAQLLVFHQKGFSIYAFNIHLYYDNYLSLHHCDWFLCMHIKSTMITSFDCSIKSIFSISHFEGIYWLYTYKLFTSLKLLYFIIYLLSHFYFYRLMLDYTLMYSFIVPLTIFITYK